MNLNILEIVFLTIVFIANALVLLSMRLGGRGIKNKTSKRGLSVLRVCLIADIFAIAGGILLW